MTYQGRWQFRPPIWAILLTLLTVIAFSALSSWQLNRAQEKEDLLEWFEGAEAPRSVSRVADLEGLPRYARVILQGRFLPDREFLLEGMRREGRPGYHVWTPFRLSDDPTLIMVDRGWIDQDQTPPEPPEGEPRQVEGQINHLPEPGWRLEAPRPSGDWPRRIYYPTQQDLEEQLDAAVHDGRLMMDSQETPGYRRDFEPINMPPERHLGYAFQWAALAVAVLLVFFVVNFKRVSRP